MDGCLGSQCRTQIPNCSPRWGGDWEPLQKPNWNLTGSWEPVQAPNWTPTSSSSSLMGDWSHSSAQLEFAGEAGSHFKRPVGALWATRIPHKHPDGV